MQTELDRSKKLKGYFASTWPVECGGNRRQKSASGGLNARDKNATVTFHHNGLWNVMMIQRSHGELYLGGTLPAFTGTPPYGWLQRLDPNTLNVIAESPQLPCGEHVWCGAIAAHENGDIYKVNGCFMHRLDPACQISKECRLPVDQAHNGLLILSDGTLITKDLRLEGQGPTTVTRLEPETLNVIGEPFLLPEGSMGRIASDITSEGEFIYIPGTEHVWRIRVEPDNLAIDYDWKPKYRHEMGDQGLAWDGCISAQHLWLMDNGDIDSVRAIYNRHPNGRFDIPSDQLSWRRPAPWRGAQRLLKISLEDAHIQSVSPFAIPGGGIIAPPVHVADFNICIVWDSINGGLAGIDTSDDELSLAWKIDARPTMQPIVFPETRELAINDFTGADDNILIVDIITGEILSRIETGSHVANGMFLTPGWDKDIYYCSTLSIARIQWA